jgi:hypothetical protein
MFRTKSSEYYDTLMTLIASKHEILLNYNCMFASYIYVYSYTNQIGNVQVELSLVCQIRDLQLHSIRFYSFIANRDTQKCYAKHTNLLLHLHVSDSI